MVVADESSRRVARNGCKAHIAATIRIPQIQPIHGVAQAAAAAFPVAHACAVADRLLTLWRAPTCFEALAGSGQGSVRNTAGTDLGARAVSVPPEGRGGITGTLGVPHVHIDDPRCPPGTARGRYDAPCPSLAPPVSWAV